MNLDDLVYIDKKMVWNTFQEKICVIFCRLTAGAPADSGKFSTYIKLISAKEANKMLEGPLDYWNTLMNKKLWKTF